MRERAILQANVYGKDFINNWVSDPIIAIVPTSENWFYIVTDKGTIYSISQKSDCLSSHFGDINHLHQLKREGINDQYHKELINILSAN